MRILLWVRLLPSSVPQQKLPEPLAGAMPVLDSGFALPHQVAQGLIRSPGLVGINVGAITSQAIPTCVNCQYSP